MAQEKPITQIKSDLDEYFDFIALINKSRPAEHQKLIDEIIKQESNTSARIKRIEKLDETLGETRTGIEVIDETGKERHPIDFSERDKESKETQIVAPRKKAIKYASFFSYVLRHRKMILNFGQRTKTLDFGLWGVNRSLSLTADVYFKQLVNDTMEVLLKATTFVIHNGWKTLDIRSYNAIVAYQKFLQIFIKNSHGFDKKASISDLFNIIESFMPAYLRVVFKPDYKDIIKDSLYEILFFNQDYKPQIRKILRITEDILNVERRDLCFFNIINSVFIIVFNRFVKLTEMFANYQTVPINIDKFNFSQKVLAEINEYKNKLAETHKETEENLFILKYLNTDDGFSVRDKGKRAYNILLKLYNMGAKHSLKDKGKEKHDIIADAVEVRERNSLPNIESDILKIFGRLSEGFRACYTQIMSERITISHQGKEVSTQLFSEYIFNDELKTIRDLSTEIRYLLTGLDTTSLDLSTYLMYISSGKTQLEKEQKYCELVSKIVREFWSLANKNTILLYRNYKAKNIKNVDLFDAYKNQSKPIQDYEGDPVIIPYYFENVNVPSFLKGKKVIEILEEISYFLINFCFFFRVPEIQKILERKDKAMEELESYIQIRAKIG